MAVEEVVGGQRDTFVISDVCCMSSAQSIIFFIYIALADKIIILDIVLTPSGVDVHHKS